MVTSCHITALKAGKHPTFCREIKHNSSMDLHICLIMFVCFFPECGLQGSVIIIVAH